MTIWGKRLSEYVEFSRLFLGLILVVGIVRLALSLGGASNSITGWFSVSVVTWIGVLYYAIRVHTRRFGTYRHLLPIYVLQMLAAQVVIVPAIILAIVTGTDNIFTTPEFNFGSDGRNWSHVAAHLLIAPTIGSLVSWLGGCLFMFVTKKLAPEEKRRSAAARG